MMMKTKIAMALSIAGVLVAGSAAALVNTQVLSGGTSAASQFVEAAPAAQQTTPVDTVAAVASAPVVAAPAPAPAPAVAAPAAAAAAPVATQAMYQIGDSGTVTLDTAGDLLTIVGVAPADGWTVAKSENNDELDAEVRFQSGAIEVEFHANLLFGVVTTSVDSHDLSTPNATVQNSGGGGYNGGSDDAGDEGGGDDD